jgi:hypothetical protein
MNMAIEIDHDRVRNLIRQQGLPPTPASATLLTEVRTDGVVPLAPPAMLAPTFSLGKLLIEWRFHVPSLEADKFNNFLRGNESFIAACCRKLMKGVDYRGTYKMTSDKAVLYKSLWAYESPAAVDQWTDTLEKDSQFVSVIKRLRSYWIKDSSRSESRYEQL